jgi:hypothetical protein
MFSYSTGYYVSPPDDQYLKFKNRCSLMWKQSRHVYALGFNKSSESSLLMLDTCTAFYRARCEGKYKSFEQVKYGTVPVLLPPLWERRAIWPNHINFMSSSALAPM